MREYEVNVQHNFKGKIELRSLVGILEEERNILLGGSKYENRWVSNGKIYKEGDHQMQQEKGVREATEEEIEVYQEMVTVENYISKLRDDEINKKESERFNPKEEFVKVLDRIKNLTPEEVQEMNKKLRKHKEENKEYWERTDFEIQTELDK